MSQLLRRHIAWLALCSLIFVSTAPSFSHLLASATNGTIWVEICSLYGSKRVALDVESDKFHADNSRATQHCLFCRLHNDLPVVLASSNVVSFEAIFTHIAPERVTNCFLNTRFIRTAHLTRAPPQVF
jgi:hypothetical protein